MKLTTKPILGHKYAYSDDFSSYVETFGTLLSDIRGIIIKIKIYLLTSKSAVHSLSA